MNPITQLQAQFDDDTAYERLVLLSLTDAEAVARGQHTIAIDLRDVTPNVTIGITEVFGSGRVVEALEPFRALIFGAAYKVLDQLVELVMDLNGASPLRGRSLMADKQAFVRGSLPRLLPDPLNQAPRSWERLAHLYDVFLEPRHSLVHRRTEVRSNGDFVGIDRSGNQLPVISGATQDIFAQTMHLVATAVIASNWTHRRQNTVEWHLDQLQHVHAMAPLGAIAPASSVPLVQTNLEILENRKMRLDRKKIADAVNEHLAGSKLEADLELYAEVDSQSVVYLVSLDDLPLDDVIEIDPSDPSWLQRRSNQI